jgi:2-haloacid dehalogenase/putative hydrolase of the HAD superfamily
MGRMLDVVCFDLMGTVVYDPYLEALEAATGLDISAAHRVKDPNSWPQFELGAIDEAEFVRRFFVDGHEAPFDIEAFHRVRRQGYAFLDGMEGLLEALAGQVGRYLASNYPVWVEEMRAQFGLDRHFDAMFVSCHMGVRKPDPAFFQALLDGVGAPAHRCLFVDDRRVNCEAAATAGMQAHLFDGAEGLRHRLAAEGLAV